MYQTYVTPPPGPHHHTERVSGIPAREAGALTRNAKGYTDARAPLFEVKKVRFTHRPYWHTHLLHLLNI